MDRIEWVRVPREPTDAMHEAMPEVSMYVAIDRFRRDYGLMLAAAPPPPAEQASGEHGKHMAVLERLERALPDVGLNGWIDGVAAVQYARAALSQRPVIRVGAYGSAFDPPNTCRAFTYEHQPGNVLASRLGTAINAAANMSAGDSIDRGLGLLKALQDEGFGVYQLAPQQPDTGEG